MITTREVMEQLTGKRLVRELVAYAEQTFEDFKEVRSKYLQSLELLRSEIGEGILPSVDDLVDAIDRQTASNLFFSGVLGIQSNYEHFIDPMARTVLDVDCDVYLCENAAQRLPEYVKAQAVMDAFFENLTPAQKETFGNVIAYTAYMETIAPKLAHFYGHILGDEFLCRVVPGYYPDEVLTMQYRQMLSTYLGVSKQLLNFKTLDEGR